MKRILQNALIGTSLLGGAMLAAPIVANAHHSHASLDMDKTQVWEGVVTEFIWKSPHMYIKAEAENANGKLMEYTIEALNPPSMAALGWDKTTFKTGDFIRWQGNPDRDPNRAYAGIHWAEKANGERLSASTRDITRVKAAARENETVIPAKKIGEGIWSRIGADGKRFKPIYAPSDDWPLTEKGQEVVARFSEADNPITKCIHNGPPRSIVSLLGFQWDQPDENTITVQRDLWPYPRVIHLNGTGTRGKPSRFGYSQGYFEGDELVVTTDNFIEDQWGHYTGIDSSDQKELTERYSLSEDGKTLRVTVTVTDPVYLSKPHSFTHQWAKLPDRPLTDAECSMENANLFRTAGYGADQNSSGPSQSQQNKTSINLLVLGLAGLGLLMFIIAVFLGRKRN